MNFFRLAFSAIAGILCVAWWLIVLTRPYGSCEKGETDATLEKTIAALDGTIDLGLKLSVPLVAAGVAILIGLKSPVPMTPGVRTLLFFSIFLFGQSALAGVLWRLDMANAWFNKCPLFVASPALEALFYASFQFFIAGIIIVLVMVGFAAFAPTSENQK